MHKYIWLIAIFYSLSAYTQPFSGDYQDQSSKTKIERKVDSVLGQLSLRDQIAQLMMVAMYPKKGKEHDLEIENLIKHLLPPTKMMYLSDMCQRCKKL